MKKLGRHILAEFTNCDCAILNEIEEIEHQLTESARRSGAAIVKSVFHRYNPHGVSGVIVIAESHISIHTWPEYGYAAVDFFTCGERVDPLRACEYLQQSLGAGAAQIIEIARGIPSENDEILAHKPESVSHDQLEPVR
ncbi:MAG: adenosylmethionine decarboxylase [Candidatus Zixiibacteriota bacterium]